MLVLTRKPGEQIVIAGNIRVSVVSIGQGRVKIGIEAPNRWISPSVMPAVSGRPGPGERTIPSGARPDTSTRVMASFLTTTTSLLATPNICARLYVKES